MLRLMSARELVFERSDHHCEVMVLVNHVYTRCGRAAPDVHHLLFRSRGGDVLDEVGETYHLINLCRTHHDWCHRHPSLAASVGMVIEGQCWLDNGPVYVGPDPYLTLTYPRRPR